MVEAVEPRSDEPIEIINPGTRGPISGITNLSAMPVKIFQSGDEFLPEQGAGFIKVKRPGCP